MLFVKTYLDKSNVHGIGLFSVEKIKKGAVVYEQSPDLDLVLSVSQFKALDVLAQKHIMYYGYFDKLTNTYRLAFDNIRFCNHSKIPNIGVDTKASKYRLIAFVEINARTEILQDYAEFEELRDDLARAR